MVFLIIFFTNELDSFDIIATQYISNWTELLKNIKKHYF